MGKRVKVTGYLNVEDEPELFDPNHPSGLTAEGFESVTGMDSVFRIADLEDIETELVD